MDVVNAVKASKMKPYQWLIVVLCMFCNMLDGFDFFAMGFVLPYLPDGFATSTGKGLLISAGLVGMALGAMTIAPLADRFGRRRLMLVGLAFNTGSVIFTALAANSEMMLFGRFLTGLGVGIARRGRIVRVADLRTRDDLLVNVPAGESAMSQLGRSGWVTGNSDAVVRVRFTHGMTIPPAEGADPAGDGSDVSKPTRAISLPSTAASTPDTSDPRPSQEVRSERSATVISSASSLIATTSPAPSTS